VCVWCVCVGVCVFKIRATAHAFKLSALAATLAKLMTAGDLSSCPTGLRKSRSLPQSPRDSNLVGSEVSLISFYGCFCATSRSPTLKVSQVLSYLSQTNHFDDHLKSLIVVIALYVN